jgi:hypothetical protein
MLDASTVTAQSILRMNENLFKIEANDYKLQTSHHLRVVINKLQSNAVAVVNLGRRIESATRFVGAR